ncbi:hypothetical protein BJX62DRAFT_229453 [Aspergillus germanicus]
MDLDMYLILFSESDLMACGFSYEAVKQNDSLFHAQPYAMRAPEAFLGQACTAPSLMWAIAAMLLCWIKPGVLGMWDSPHPLLNKAWCLAKIKRLREIPEPQTILAFDEELQNVEMLQQLRDLLRFMFGSRPPSKRPSAASVLSSRELRELAKLVGV